MQKFQYLRGAVSGDAASVIQSLEISDKNYEEAWNLLRERYDNTRVIVYTHIRKILEIPVMPKENVLELRKMADNTSKHIRALVSLKVSADKWDDILVCILTSKLDALTAREWHHSLKDSSLPSLKQFLSFITRRCQALEGNQKLAPATATSRLDSKRQSAAHAATINAKCAYCRGDHPIYYCADFLKLSVDKRIKEVRKRKLCVNCLRAASHTSAQCNSRSCQTCDSKHNTLLHLETSKDVSKDVVSKKSNSEETASQTTVATHSAVQNCNDDVLLSTAVIYAVDRQGSAKTCRALLDCGSQANFITKKFFETLNLKSRPLNISIKGINRVTSTAHHVATLTIQSRVNSFATPIDCIITNQITGQLPALTINRKNIAIPHNIKLADPQFHVSSEIDLLIGADLFWQLLCVGQIKSLEDCPMLHKTVWGGY
ncbi:PREDICTED: uncharacterized protein LOC105557242 [Vollenhovia emeryi]|uniref:uncharacterized protein LOC105557242 n=1 Tax=Vollenhovia emeryi TaxID=411798 RepID=UPI0005F37B58|nr:PREDICTED: uncharacterized protein LOC105557242 [Vollenhovia emeryi]